MASNMRRPAPACGAAGLVVTPVRALLLSLACTTIAWPLTGAAQGAPIETRLSRLEQKLDNQGLLDLLTQIEQLQSEVRRLRGDLENQAYTIEQLRKGQTDIYNNLDQRLGAIEQGGTAIAAIPGTGTVAVPGAGTEPPLSTLSAPGAVAVAGQPADPSMAVAIGNPVTVRGEAGAALIAPAGAPTGGPIVNVQSGNTVAAIDASAPLTPPAQPASTSITPPITATAPNGGPGTVKPSIVPPAATQDSPESEAAYRAAFAMLKEGRYEDSIEAFNTYLQQYPDSQYADNAQYWLGEAYYVMRQFEPAIEQYQRLVQNYPQSQKQSHALLKVAYSYSELGLDEQALGVLNDLKARYPGSAAARLADERMQRIRARTP